MNDTKKSMTETELAFYETAYAYFAYHAEQRMNMINFYIAVFGAGIAFYGSVLLDVPTASIGISLFLIIVSVLFYQIDIRNKFDVKQSQAVLCAFEQEYGVSSSLAHPAFGVFSNEDNTFILYDRSFRKKYPLYKNLRKNKKKLENGELQAEVDEILKARVNVSARDVEKSLTARPIPHLSSCISFLYGLCLAISVVGFAAAVLQSIFG